MIAAAMLAAVAIGAVELRGGVVVDAPVVSVSLAGVEVGGDEPRVIGWDGVKRVTGEYADEAGAFAEVAEQAWRARIRLARGDYGMARPLYEDLAERYKDQDGPTALVVAEGLLACRLWFGDRVGAVEAWLEAVRLRSAGWKIAGDPPMRPLLDPETLLVPGLPPIWAESHELSALAGEGAIPVEEGLSGQLRLLYRVAARRAMGLAVEPEIEAEIAAGASQQPGVEFVRQIVAAMSDDGTRRRAARHALSRGVDDDIGTWREAWRRSAIGASLLLDADDGARLTGVFELLHVPARFGAAQPDLSAIALGKVAAELVRRGDGSGEAIVTRELERLYPDHPARAWLARERKRIAIDAAKSEDSPKDKEDNPLFNTELETEVAP